MDGSVRSVHTVSVIVGGRSIHVITTVLADNPGKVCVT